MKTESNAHPDKDLHDATLQSFVERQCEHPLPGVLILILLALILASAAIYIGKDDAGPIIGIEILAAVAAGYLLGNSCKKAISRSKRMQQKHFKQQILQKALH